MLFTALLLAKKPEGSLRYKLLAPFLHSYLFTGALPCKFQLCPQIPISASSTKHVRHTLPVLYPLAWYLGTVPLQRATLCAEFASHVPLLSRLTDLLSIAQRPKRVASYISACLIITYGYRSTAGSIMASNGIGPLQTFVKPSSKPRAYFGYLLHFSCA